MTAHHPIRPLPPVRVFYAHLIRSGLFAAGAIAVSLTIGTVGYHTLADFPWIDALMNATMILTGMGPADHIETAAGKLFATAYALYSGVVFLSTTAIILSPFATRFLHRFHLDIHATDRK